MLIRISDYVKGLFRSQKGQGMVEYALILALVAVVAMVGYTTLGNNVNARVNAVANHLQVGQGGGQQGGDHD